MPYAILTLDKPDSDALRATLRADHIAYLVERQHMMLVGGALQDEAGQPHGGIIIIDTDDKQVADDFAANDPFTKGGLFREVKVVRWRKSFLDFKRYT
jgi:uncharacterized protein YciI